MADLGRWLSEDYRVPGEPVDEGLPREDQQDGHDRRKTDDEDADPEGR